MRAYILCIIIVTLINILNEFVFKSKTGKFTLFNKFLFVISLLIPCVIAGARDITVGTDVRGYVLRLSNVVSSSPNFIHYLMNANSDIFFSILVYIGYFSKNFNVLLFFIELAVALPIYLYAYLEKDKIPFTVNILVFLLTMYCLSLSMMRQSIAMSICILSFHFIEKKNYNKSIFLIIISLLFHKTGFVFFAIFITYYLFNRKDKNSLSKLLYLVLEVTALLLVSPFIDKIIGSTMYSSYLSYYENFRGFSIMSLLKKLLFVGLWGFCILSSRNKSDYEISWFGLCISIISLFCVYESFTYSGMGRIGYYFSNLSSILIVREFAKKFKQKRIIMIVLLIGYSILWWNMTYVINDPASIYPYTSSSFDFLN